MEVVKGILALESDYSSYSSGTDADIELSSYGLEKCSVVTPTTIAACPRAKVNSDARKRNGEERLPTRRPDPNVYNRNALLARENRRKKKLYLECVERELQEARTANRDLVKALKRQIKISRQLEQQKKYYQNIIANRTEISNLFSVLSNFDQQEKQLSSTDDLVDDRRHEPSYSFSSSSFDLEQLSNDCGIQHGSVTDDNRNELRDISSIDFCNLPNFFTDFESSSWDNIWKKCDQSNAENLTGSLSTMGSNGPTVFDDHCYVASSSDIQSSPEHQSSNPAADYSLDGNIGAATANGICIHINRGKDSLEFCPTCHWNSTSRNPPLQLLSDEMLL